MMKFLTISTSLILALAFGSAANADSGTPISISNAVDSNLYTFTGGTSYPSAGSTVTIGGVNFVLAPFYTNNPSAPDVGVVITGDGSPTSAQIDTGNVAVGANTVFYSLINSGFGVDGATIGNLTFNFSDGSDYVYNLVEGDNVRDHYNGNYNNIATNVYGTATYGNDRLDAQQILPTSFIGDTLTSITLNNTNTAGGNPFLTAFTVVNGVAAVPETATWAMMLIGMGAIGGVMRRGKKVATRVSYAV